MDHNLKRIYLQMSKSARSGNVLCISKPVMTVNNVIPLEEQGCRLVKQEYASVPGRASYSISWEIPERPNCIASYLLKHTIIALHLSLDYIPSASKAEVKDLINQLVHNFPIAERDKLVEYISS